MPYRIAGIDVHKRMLAVVVADVAADGECMFEQRLVGTTPTEGLRALAAWLVEREVEEVVMESTARYWRPVLKARNETGNRLAAPARTRGHRPARCISRRPTRTRETTGGSKISPMRNGWSDAWSRTN